MDSLGCTARTCGTVGGVAPSALADAALLCMCGVRVRMCACLEYVRFLSERCVLCFYFGKSVFVFINGLRLRTRNFRAAEMFFFFSLRHVRPKPLVYARTASRRERYTRSSQELSPPLFCDTCFAGFLARDGFFLFWHTCQCRICVYYLGCSL